MNYSRRRCSAAFAVGLLTLLWAFSLSAQPQECPNIPLPKVNVPTEKICHTGYIVLYDTENRLPRLVAYELTPERTLGCLPRQSRFHAEGPSAKPGEYRSSGYDLGHMMPAQDAAYDKTVAYESFSMLNIAPQLPGLNRKQWERLEEAARAWAWERGDC